MYKEFKICVIGLGYVGLPLAVSFSKHFSTIGFDINKKRINSLKKNIDTNNELYGFRKKKLLFTCLEEDIKNSNFYVIAVPTPVNKKNLPDLRNLIKASRLVGSVLKKNDFVVYESTVYPGLTEEVCIKILEKVSGLNVTKEKKIQDFYCGYSPERINPGDKINKLNNITKIVSANNFHARKIIHNVYKNITKRIHVAKSIKIAESAKVIENAQRDINIAFINELSLIFNKLNINFKDILKAASTKWNFVNFTPGLVGGHCIGVDPFYLAHKSILAGYTPKVLLSGRKINDQMSIQFAKNFLEKIKKIIKDKKKYNILVLGLSFKENVKDIRNSKVFDSINYLKKKHNVKIYDPIVSKLDVPREYHKMFSKLKERDFFDGVFISSPHSIFLKNLFLSKLEKCCRKKNVVFDLKHKLNMTRNKLNIVSA